MKTKSKLGTTCSMTMARHSRIVCTARLLLLFVLLALPAVVQAQFNYTTENGTITITGYTGPGGAVTIPSTINGLPVTRIGDLAFSPGYNGTLNLTSVTIPNSVTSIGDSAFLYCTSLTNVTIGNSVTSIGNETFWACTSLTSVTIPNSVTNIGYSAFRYCTSLTAITVDALNSAYSSVDGVLFNKSQTTLIQSPARKAGSYTIPNSVTYTGDWAFGSCTSLTSVTIGNSVTNIGVGAFSYCASLTSVTIPNSITRIGAGAFSGCTSLLSVTIPNSVTSIESDYAMYSFGAFSGCTSLTNVTIGNGVTNIGAESFSFCTSLTSVTIPNSVTSIGDWAFQYCTGLTSVTIGPSVTSIGAGAFAGCTSLTAITVDALNPAYSSGDGVLFNKSQTTLIQYPGGKAGSYTIPNSVTTIEGLAFYLCTSLNNVTIGNSVTSIGSGTFWNCTSLNNVTIGNSVTSIEDYAFAGCTNLTGVYFNGNAPSVGFGVFDGANKTTVYYLPGTTGWGATFAGRPTAQWLPEARASDADFGVRTNQFGFNIRWASDKVVVVEASPDLSNPVWTPVSTNTLTGGSSYFSDPQWTNHPARFYRLRSP